MAASAQLKEDRRAARRRALLLAGGIAAVAVVVAVVALAFGGGDDGGEASPAVDELSANTGTAPDGATDDILPPDDQPAPDDAPPPEEDPGPIDDATTAVPNPDCDVAGLVGELAEGPDDDLDPSGAAVCGDGYAAMRVRRNYDFGFEELIGIFRGSGDSWEPVALVIDAVCPSFTDPEGEFPPSLCDLS